MPLHVSKESNRTNIEKIRTCDFSSSTAKWMYANGLVILLPHGFDGMASEHSSCRMERFLQLTGDAFLFFFFYSFILFF